MDTEDEDAVTGQDVPEDRKLAEQGNTDAKLFVPDDSDEEASEDEGSEDQGSEDADDG